MPDLPDMPGGLRRAGRVAAATVVAALWTLGVLMASPASAAAPADRPVASDRPAAEDPCAAPADGTDEQAVITAALACLQSVDDHIAILGAKRYTAGQFTDAVERARSHNVTLWVVILGDQTDEDGASRVADGILHQVGGTVVVVTPDYFGLASEQFGQSDLDDAGSAVTQGDDVSVVTTIVNSLTAKPFPWLLVVSVTIAVLVLGAFAGGLWTRRRRHHADDAALADLTAGLAGRVNDVAPTIVALSDQVDITQRPDLSDRFDRATGDYDELRDKLATPLPNRAAVNEAAAAVQELTDELTSISQEVTAALGQQSQRPPQPS